jgi:hypothetical protein
MRWIACFTTALAATPVMALGSDPASIPAPSLKVGDTWVFERTHEQGTTGFSDQRIDLTIDRVNSDTMLVGIKRDGAPNAFEDHMSGVDWSQRRMVGGQETITGRPFSFPLKIGDSWTADYADPQRHGLQTYAKFHTTYRVVGWEDITVPAGTFHALKVEANGTGDAQLSAPAAAATAAVADPSGGTTIAHTQRARTGVAHFITYAEFYYVPDIKYFVKSVEEQYNANNVRTTRDTQTLVSFKASS